MEIKKYEKDGIEYIEDIIPKGYMVIHSYIPTICPYDHYGNLWQKHMKNRLEPKQIPFLLPVVRRRKLHPIGTGPNKTIRFGDDMLPYEYKVAVPIKYSSVANGILFVSEKQMDPNETFLRFVNANTSCATMEAFQALEDLNFWLKNGGCLPCWPFSQIPVPKQFIYELYKAYEIAVQTLELYQ